MSLPILHGIIPPLPTPLTRDERLDETAFARLVAFHIKAGVHGLWILGTTARFDQVPDREARRVAEIATEANRGRLPLVLNVSDGGTRRTLERAKRFDDLPYDTYAALPPWYQPMAPAEVVDYYRALADQLARPLVIYNAPWVCNQLSFENLRLLAEHPRIVGVKDVTPGLFRPLDWPSKERKAQGFQYLLGNDLLANAIDLGADGFVSALADAFPEVAVAIWNAMRDNEISEAFRLQSQFSRLGRATNLGPMLGCLEVACRHRGLLQRMLPSPYRSLDDVAAKRVIEAIEDVGMVP
ncbi:MAG: dihydrodipicolinate synthase/N-acetylneuraminate lyase [Planctomycetota bacterium]|nr:dihydrodipicolinate synthase/N-acetylneuraminate lyase [Planctomycetota bacterium]